MDKIWYRNPSKLKFMGFCGGDEKPEWPRRTDKSRTKEMLNWLLTSLWTLGQYSRLDGIFSHLQLYKHVLSIVYML